ncbi:MAG: hypothetical protein NC400_11030 [Clostridium sp.]|nr:hypothetical protein [Clostridium sp.]
MNVIREYLERTKLPTVLLNKKMAMYERHPDIAEEFKRWIQTGEYLENGVSVENYTAEKIAELSELMDGEGAFTMLIQLRETPDKALRRIERGFKMR